MFPEAGECGQEPGALEPNCMALIPSSYKTASDPVQVTVPSFLTSKRGMLVIIASTSGGCYEC